MKTEYFRTYEDAQSVAERLKFKPSRFLTSYEIARGDAVVKILSFERGFAIQLGHYGEYFPNTNPQITDS